MTEEKSNNRTLILIITVGAFLMIGLVSILKERETQHLNYSENTSVEQEAELYKNVKDYNNIAVPGMIPTQKGSSKKATPKKHTMQNTQPSTKQSTEQAPRHSMQNSQPFTDKAPKHTMQNN